MSLTEVALQFWRPSRPINITDVLTGYAVLMGYSVKESTGSASAELDVYNSTAATGLLVIPMTLTAGQSAEDWFGPQGLEMSVGIFCNVASGAVSGSLWIYDHLGSNR